MCIIAYRRKGMKISNEIIRECFASHGHGAGIAYATEEDGLVIDKGFFNVADLIIAIDEAGDCDMLIHFRTASKGMKINHANCHPFAVDSETGKDGDSIRYQFAIAHNGKLDWRNTKSLSDTACFVADVLDPILQRDPWFFDNDATTVLVDGFIGKNNKIVVMKYDRKDKSTSVTIVNERAGNYHEGVWYSNFSWKPRPPIVITKYHAHTQFPLDDGSSAASRKRWRCTPPKATVDGETIEWEFPDKWGWFWNFEVDMWENNKTKVITQNLSSRTKPYELYGDGISISAPYVPPKIQPEPQKSEIQLRLESGIGDDVSDPEPVEIPGIDHLNKDEIAMLCKISRTVLRDIMGFTNSAIKRMGAAEKIDWLRDWAKESYKEECGDLDVINLDICMVAKIKAGTLKVDPYQYPETNVNLTDIDSEEWKRIMADSWVG